MQKTINKVDAHHHLWDLGEGDYPWLQKPAEGRMYGDYSAICKNYLLDDFLKDARPHNVTQSVHVQANWNAADPVGETRWLQDIADRHGYPHGIVAHVDLAANDAEKLLEEHQQYANMRGVRHIFGHTDDPQCSRPSPADDPAWETGYALLAQRGLTFDLQAFPPQMDAFMKIAQRHPDVAIIVCHTGFPYDRSAEGVALWREGMRNLANLPHCNAKLSGPGMVMPNWTEDSFAPFIHETIELFGPERCMFASNVPPDSLSKPYEQIYQAFYAWAARYNEAEQQAMFSGTAKRIYRL